MHPYVWIPLLASLAAAVMMGAILSRDPGQRVNRLLALVLAGSTWWSLCEVLANTAQGAEWAARWLRLSGPGWIGLGALCLHIYAELDQAPRSRARRGLPLAYASAGVAMVLYAVTPWGIAEAVPTEWGWAPRFGPLFLLVYGPTAVCVGYVLWRWPQFFASGVSPVERRLAVGIFAAIAVSLTVSSTTDALLPSLGLDPPRLGSTSLLFLGSIAAWSVSRHGYFLMAPAAFAREILETLRDGVLLLDEEGRVRSGNRAVAELVGLPPEALADRRLSELLPRAGGAPSESFVGRDGELRRADGERIPVSLSSSQLCDEKGRPVGRVLAVRDLREVTALRNRLVTSGRLAAVGELAAGIAHEINNPVTFISANLVQLREQWRALAKNADAQDPLLHEGEELIGESLQGVDRIAAIVRDVRAFSHAGLDQAQWADVNELLENAANVAALRYAVTVERCYGELPRVRCAPHQLRQVFLNLIFNALQAIDGSGHIRLVTQHERDAVQVRVEDDGCGIPPELIDRIFDPFFTTRPAGEGTGLGLSLCYQIVRNHGGDVTVESRPGCTRFLVRLPAV
jgi:PAS domain S-box-containing protein